MQKAVSSRIPTPLLENALRQFVPRLSGSFSERSVLMHTMRTARVILSLNGQKRMKTAQVNLQIEPALKAAAEKAAAADNRSLAELIEKLLADYCKKRALAGEASSSRARAKGSPKAAEMAGRTIDDIGDKTLPSEEQQRRKRRLIRGPKEFREMRRK